MDPRQPPAVPQERGVPGPPGAMRGVRPPGPQLRGDIFGSLEESPLPAAELAPLAQGPRHLLAPHLGPDGPFPAMSGPCPAPAPLPAPLPLPAPAPLTPAPLPLPALDGPAPAPLQPLSPPLAVPGLPAPPAAPGGPLPVPAGAPGDPRELEAFAERFKQRRLRLGVTQAGVGAALAALRLPGVGSLSQSTICRFESLTLSHNNMRALRPALQAWLEGAEAARRAPGSPADPQPPAGPGHRRRSSIAAPERRSLEAFFALQPRPSAEKIAAIAQKLELKRNVVRVWFCNQRQKQKRMKYSALR